MYNNWPERSKQNYSHGKTIVAEIKLYTLREATKNILGGVPRS